MRSRNPPCFSGYDAIAKHADSFCNAQIPMQRMAVQIQDQDAYFLVIIAVAVVFAHPKTHALWQDNVLRQRQVHGRFCRISAGSAVIKVFYF